MSPLQKHPCAYLLTSGWNWDGGWQVDTSGPVDKEGWTYGLDLGSLQFPFSSGHDSKGFGRIVRRRRLIRRSISANLLQCVPQPMSWQCGFSLCRLLHHYTGYFIYLYSVVLPQTAIARWRFSAFCALYTD